MRKFVLPLLVLICTLFITNLPAFSDVISDDISRVEMELFGVSFSNKENSARLSAIEKDLYGIEFSKNSVSKRLEKIKKDLGHSTVLATKNTNSDYGVPVPKISSENMQPQKEQGEAEYPMVDKLEATVFKTVYKSDSIYKRLSRLEQKVFGTTNQTSALTDRVSALNKVVRTPNERLTQANSSYNQPNRTVMQDYSKTTTTAPRQLGRYSSNRNYDFEVGILEEKVFGQTYNGSNVEQRLAKLENKLFKREFASDDFSSRIDRLTTVLAAQSTSHNYDSNKFKQFLSTGMQVGSVILLILAAIF
ncbi:hypothetical protein J6Q66_02145 [bacterium]|nr:hypothetical protein [bacterium]